MKKAVIATGGKQYLVAEGDALEIEILKQEGKSVTFTPLLVIDGETTVVGTPEAGKFKVTGEITDAEVKADKVIAIRYKAKKRVKKVRGHRQIHTAIKITKIA